MESEVNHLELESWQIQACVSLSCYKQKSRCQPWLQCHGEQPLGFPEATSLPLSPAPRSPALTCALQQLRGCCGLLLGPGAPARLRAPAGVAAVGAGARGVRRCRGGSGRRGCGQERAGGGSARGRARGRAGGSGRRGAEARAAGPRSALFCKTGCWRCPAFVIEFCWLLCSHIIWDRRFWSLTVCFSIQNILLFPLLQGASDLLACFSQQELANLVYLSLSLAG